MGAKLRGINEIWSKPFFNFFYPSPDQFIPNYEIYSRVQYVTNSSRSAIPYIFIKYNYSQQFYLILFRSPTIEPPLEVCIAASSSMQYFPIHLYGEGLKYIHPEYIMSFFKYEILSQYTSMGEVLGQFHFDIACPQTSYSLFLYIPLKASI